MPSPRPKSGRGRSRSGRQRRGSERGARARASAPSPTSGLYDDHATHTSLTTILEEKNERKLVVVLKSFSERFKGFLLGLEREQFHAERENLVVKLAVGSEGLRALGLGRGGTEIKNSGEAKRQRQFAATPTVSEKRISGTAPGLSVDTAPDTKVVDIEQLPTPESDNSPKNKNQTAEAGARMAPMEKADVDDELKSLIQTLYTIQSITSGYLPSSQPALTSAFSSLASQLSSLNSLTLPPSHPSSTSTPAIQSVQIPESILDYLDAGRNPDIYTREFVELDQRGNAALKGKMQAFGEFSQVLAGEMKGENGIGGLGGEVDRVLEMYGLADSVISAGTENEAERNGDEKGEICGSGAAEGGAATTEPSQATASDLKTER
ncbi:MAG: hypothetical protein Q9160_008336 [Pyrenula sp. 1 TL-2023]